MGTEERARHGKRSVQGAYLGCHVVRGTNKRARSPTGTDFFAEADVRQSNVPGGGQEDILQLQVSIDDASLVHLLQGQNDACSVVLGVLFPQPIVFNNPLLDVLAFRCPALGH